MSAKVKETMAKRDNKEGRELTKREQEILELIARGYTNKNIAAELGITERTVKNQVSSILTKLGALNRAHAVILAKISQQLARQIINSKKKTKSETAWYPDMLTPRDAAKYLGVHTNTVRVWSDKGILKSYRIGARGDRRFRREDIDDFLKEEEI